MKTKTLVCTALFAALTAILSQIAIPLPGLVPLNLATLSVFLCGALLGPVQGAASQIVYLALGAIGIPVFSGFRAGLSALAGPTGGYLIGYVVAAFLVGLLVRAKPSHTAMLPIAMVVGLVACYALGTAWYMLFAAKALLPALTMCVFPFLIGDALKIAVATVVVRRVGVMQFRSKAV